MVERVKTQFASDMIWNFISFGIVGFSGLLINLIVGRYYLPTDLGAFNQVFAFYIVGAQFAALGVQYSALKFSSEADGAQRIRQVTTAAVAVAAMLALPASVVLYVLKSFIAKVFESPALEVGIGFVAPAIGLFAVNKVLIAVLNGIRRMKLFAIFQAVRFLCLLLFIAAAAVLGLSSIYLSLAFLVAELLLVVCLVGTIVNVVGFTAHGIKQAAATHLRFGMKSFMGGAVTELNSRVDILMLGVFTTDAQVGLYSMAAMINEGISQLAVVVRNNVNPLLARYYFRREYDQLHRLIRATIAYSYAGMLVVAVVCGLLYPHLLALAVGNDAYAGSWIVFIILMLGVLVCSGYLPLDMLLIQTGFPGWHTVIRSLTLAINVLLNLALIPSFGIVGAAIATAFSFVLSIIILRFISNKLLAVRI